MAFRSSWVLTALLAASGVSAQQGASLECDDEERWGDGRGHACEVRELTLRAAGGELAVDAGANGSIDVTGENRQDVLVRARVHAWASDDAEAARIAREITVQSDGVLRATGPIDSRRSGWSVSYEVLAPQEIDLDLKTSNGSIAVAAVRGALALEAHNGGISLDGVGGHVRGRTTNGAVDARLIGDRWDGTGLELRTTNGGVRLRIPEQYSARLETGTVNGGVDIDFPVSVKGRLGRELSTTLGDGGALLRASTTNGQVRISRSSAGLRQIQ